MIVPGQEGRDTSTGMNEKGWRRKIDERRFGLEGRQQKEDRAKVIVERGREVNGLISGEHGGERDSDIFVPTTRLRVKYVFTHHPLSLACLETKTLAAELLFLRAVGLTTWSPRISCIFVEGAWRVVGE